MKPYLNLERWLESWPEHWSERQRAQAQTLFYKELSLATHRFYRGKVQTLPKAGIYGFPWFNVWYTPGVSRVSTTIRDNPRESFALSNRSRLVGVVSDSTRVLGDGDCGPAGGLGVMEGKAMLMKYLGGIDAVALCVDSRDAQGQSVPERLIDFVLMAAPSFGAINLEDISQPNCYTVLDELRRRSPIPVWHDDAQGTGCVTLAGVINALKLTRRTLADTRFVLLGAGAANTTIANLLILAGADPERMALFDKDGGIHPGRSDYRHDPRMERLWSLADRTNPARWQEPSEACAGADVLIALSTPGPDTIPPAWIRSMNRDAVVFACANPVPEIYPAEALKAGARIVATGRGDFPNQVNNSLGFPGILRGTLSVSARAISDTMAIRAAEALAESTGNGLRQDHILPSMEDPHVHARVAGAIADQACQEGLALHPLPGEEVAREALEEIRQVHAEVRMLMEEGFIPTPPEDLIRQARDRAIQGVD